jgi:predicted GNAT family acetyltransferase
MEIVIVDNKERNRFETPVNGEFAYLDYEYYKGGIALVHTFVPPKDRHQGIAFALVKFALEYGKAQHLKVIIGCSTVTTYINLHPEYESLLKTNDPP